jgi:hypothetical protein
MEKAHKSAREELHALKTSYSLGTMAQVLRTHPEFSSVSRSTIARWLEAGKRLPPRALLAIRVLKGKSVQSKITVAYPENNVWTLPAMILDRAGQDAHPHLTRIKKTYGLQIENTPVPTGKAGLDLLKDRKVDVAFASPELIRDHVSSQTVCTVTVGRIGGVSAGVVEDIPALRNKRVGFPKGTALGALIEQRWHDLLTPIPVADRAAGVESLRRAELGMLVWWPPVTNDIMKELGGQGDFHLIPEYIFGRIEVNLAVRKRRTQPRLIRAYLRCVLAAVELLRERPPSKQLLQRLEEWLSPLTARDIAQLLERCRFGTFTRDLSPVLDLWDAEVEFKQQ